MKVRSCNTGISLTYIQTRTGNLAFDLVLAGRNIYYEENL